MVNVSFAITHGQLRVIYCRPASADFSVDA